ncbi:MAG: 3-hydroxyacyl-CoA dehydrogenase [Halieaceae bacterium]|jgi:3-hydroxyacyl-CoA dehydrogenase
MSEQELASPGVQHLKAAEALSGNVADIPVDTLTLPIARVGVIGAGTMGGGISMNMANIGIPVSIVETNPEALDRGLAVIRKNYERTASKGRITQDEVEERCGLISGHLDMEVLADCDLIIEAVYEELEVKKSIFRKLDQIARPGAILASNTSGLDLNEIAQVTNRPEAVIGMHFFSPANVMKLLEVVRGDHTSSEVIKTVMKFGRAINKVSVLVGVCPGFVGNRILYTRQLQAQALMLEGALPAQIDAVLRDFGMPMGPFQMSDLAGLDLGWNREKSNSETIRDCLCELDRRGQKAGAGWYDYDENRKPSPSPVVTDLIVQFSENAGITRRDISDDEILERCIYPMINEGAKILAEGMAQRASDIDVVWVFGYGWPADRGGPMYYADSIGLKSVVEKLRKYGEAAGDNFWEPSTLLVELAENDGSFS